MTRVGGNEKDVCHFIIALHVTHPSQKILKGRLAQTGSYQSLSEPSIVLDARTYTARMASISHCIGVTSTPASGVMPMSMA